MSERILVTGGAGFIGLHLTRTYLEAGHEVAVLDNHSSPHQQKWVYPPGFRHFYHDDICNASDVLAACEKFRPTIVNHHAAQSTVMGSMSDPALTYDTNVIGTLNVLRAAQQVGAKRLIFASSGAVYGNARAATEEGALQPLSVYGLTKQVGEQVISSFCDFHGMERVIFRYGNVYGPGQSPFGEAGVVAIFAGRLLRGEPLIFLGDGKQQRDYIHVADVCRANLLALVEQPGTYNIATGTGLDLWQVSSKLAQALNAEMHVKFAAATPGDARAVDLCIHKADNWWEFTAAIPFEEGLLSVVDYLRNIGVAA